MNPDQEPFGSITSEPPDNTPVVILEHDGQGTSGHHMFLMGFTVLWGANFVLAEVALRELSPISFSVSRFLVAAFTMVLVLYIQCRIDSAKSGVKKSILPEISPSHWPLLLLVSLVGATLAPWLGIEGLKLTSAGRASLWLAFGPVLSAGLGYLLHTERISRLGFAGIAIAFLGTMGLALENLSGEQGHALGDTLLFLSLCCTAAELHLLQPLVRVYGPVSMVAIRSVIGGLIYLLIASPSMIHQPWFDLGIWTWVAILAGGAVGVGLGQWVKVRALNTLGPTRVVLYGNLVPPATMILAWLVLQTVPSIVEVLSGALIILGAFFLQMSGLRSVLRPRFSKD